MAQVFKGTALANPGTRVRRSGGRLRLLREDRRETFKGTLSDWFGTTQLPDEPHPWEKRALRTILEADRVRDIKQAQGIVDQHMPRTQPPPLECDERMAAVDRFVESERLEMAGVDRVLAALDRRRYVRGEE